MSDRTNETMLDACEHCGGDGGGCDYGGDWHKCPYCDEGYVFRDVEPLTQAEARAIDLAIADSLKGKLCSDCPPERYGNATRCLPCPRRAMFGGYCD